MSTSLADGIKHGLLAFAWPTFRQAADADRYLARSAWVFGGLALASGAMAVLFHALGAADGTFVLAWAAVMWAAMVPLVCRLRSRAATMATAAFMLFSLSNSFKGGQPLAVTALLFLSVYMVNLARAASFYQAERRMKR